MISSLGQFDKVVEEVWGNKDGGDNDDVSDIPGSGVGGNQDGGDLWR